MEINAVLTRVRIPGKGRIVAIHFLPTLTFIDTTIRDPAGGWRFSINFYWLVWGLSICFKPYPASK